ncbi:MAG: Gfo/Idh/MocA family oxidoreductase [Clostridia bacterium]|nr:Gfo/Idh/MocA family oxidoreductase [Clostridia bacterium]
MRRIKAVQIGLGHDHAPAPFVTMPYLSDLFELCGLVIPSEEEGKYDRKKGAVKAPLMTLSEALENEEIEAVFIETEEKYLTKYSILSLKAGKHVYMDKPGGSDHEEFLEAIRLAKEKGKVLHMGYMYRYNPVISDLMKKIKEGYLGEIFSVEAQMNGISPPTEEKRHWLSGIDGGMMYFLGCHMVDLVISILGEPEEIIPHNIATGHSGKAVNDYGLAIFKYKNAQAIVKSSAAEYGGFPRRQLVVCGSKGTAEVKPLEMHSGGDAHHTTVCYYMNPVWNDMGETLVSEEYDRYKALIESFGLEILGKIENPYTAEYEIAVHKATLKAAGIIK